MENKVRGFLSNLTRKCNASCEEKLKICSQTCVTCCVFNDIYLLTGHPFCETPTGQVELLHCFGLEGNLKKSRAVEEKKARDEKLFSLISLYT